MISHWYEVGGLLTRSVPKVSDLSAYLLVRTFQLSSRTTCLPQLPKVRFGSRAGCTNILSIFCVCRIFPLLKMMELSHHQIYIKFDFNLEESFAATIEMWQKAFGDDFRRQQHRIISSVCDWLSVEEDHRFTVREVESDFGIR